MDTKKAQKMINQIIAHTKKSGDGFMYFYASVEDDRFIGGNHNMDTGDALMIIRKLVDTFGLDKSALIATLTTPFGSPEKLQ